MPTITVSANPSQNELHSILEAMTAKAVDSFMCHANTYALLAAAVRTPAEANAVSHFFAATPSMWRALPSWAWKEALAKAPQHARELALSMGAARGFEMPDSIAVFAELTDDEIATLFAYVTTHDKVTFTCWSAAARFARLATTKAQLRSLIHQSGKCRWLIIHALASAQLAELDDELWDLIASVSSDAEIERHNKHSRLVLLARCRTSPAQFARIAALPAGSLGEPPPLMSDIWTTDHWIGTIRELGTNLSGLRSAVCAWLERTAGPFVLTYAGRSDWLPLWSAALVGPSDALVDVLQRLLEVNKAVLRREQARKMFAWNLGEVLAAREDHDAILAALRKGLKAKGLLDALDLARTHVHVFLGITQPQAPAAVVSGTTADRLRRLASELADHKGGSQPRKFAERTTTPPSDADPNRLHGDPIGVSAKRWPKHNGSPLQHLMTLESSALSEAARTAMGDAAAFAVFVEDPSDLTGALEVVLLSDADLRTSSPPLVAAKIPGVRLDRHALSLPNALFKGGKKWGALKELRDLLNAPPGILLTDETSARWIQTPEPAGTFLVQVTEAFAPSLNCGDEGALFVFNGGAVFQSA